ncbi:metal ABC transporter solute-binding protein, Zn/Mn family [Halobacillus sp. Marseille-Q1614]|uniref:metal ABC transporter solute-binding protein, Zn/Mn family n=1 Tax=Halobacillus sp. Marseille-Q1614 TaxID=2709134 RepID=UPI00156F505C|nr:zinc ABC transporter substrate-binding protein [Halobacillus sp. Marseille-Q1614]
MRRAIISVFILIGILLLGACSNQSSEEEKKTLKINTTVYPLQYFTERIAGEKAEVNSILPAGSDAHSYEPSTKEMVKLAEAEAFIYNGAGLESYAEKISDAIESEDVAILEAANGLDLEKSGHSHDEEENHDDDHVYEEESHSDENSHEEGNGEQDSHDEKESHEGHDHGENDPHIWLDPVRSIQLAENIKEMLVELQPESEEQFNENFEALKAELEELDKKFHDEVAGQDKKEIIVSHAAYGYWEQAYGIEQIAVSGLSPTNEPSQKELENIIKTAEENDLNYVLFEQNITPKVSEVVQKEIGAEPLRVHNLSVLTEEDIEAEEDYFSLMNKNINVLNQALTE